MNKRIVRKVTLNSVSAVEVKASIFCCRVRIYSEDEQDFYVFTIQNDNSTRQLLRQLDLPGPETRGALYAGGTSASEAPPSTADPTTLSYGWFQSVSGVGPLVVEEIR